MKDFFKDIFTYHHHFNWLIIDQVELHASSLPERTYPLLCHVLNAAQIWSSRILLTPSLGVHQLHSYDECRRIETQNLQDLIRIADHYQLDEIVQYRTSAGLPYANSVRDILYHVANHSAHHKGQIISDFRASGIEPLVTYYILYKRT